MSETPTDRAAIAAHTAAVVSAYVAYNPVPVADLPGLIASVADTLGRLGTAAAPAAAERPTVLPTAAEIRRSITPDALISFIDGKLYKTLKRHLTKHGLDLAAYRKRYGLAADYPSTAPNYSAARSALAKEAGLGRPGAMASRGASTKASLKRAA